MSRSVQGGTLVIDTGAPTGNYLKTKIQAAITLFLLSSIITVILGVVIGIHQQNNGPIYPKPGWGGYCEFKPDESSVLEPINAWTAIFYLFFAAWIFLATCIYLYHHWGAATELFGFEEHGNVSLRWDAPQVVNSAQIHGDFFFSFLPSRNVLTSKPLVPPACLLPDLLPDSLFLSSFFPPSS